MVQQVNLLQVLLGLWSLCFKVPRAIGHIKENIKIKKVRESRVGIESLNRLFEKGKKITFKQISRKKKIKTNRD